MAERIVVLRSHQAMRFLVDACAALADEVNEPHTWTTSDDELLVVYAETVSTLARLRRSELAGLSGSEAASSPDHDRSPRTRILAGAIGLAETMTRLIPQRLRMSLVERVGAVVAGGASLRYLDSRQMPIVAAPDQPMAHWYFHRPLHELLSPAFEAGLVLDGLAEPRFWDRQTAQTGLLVCRLRRP